VEARLLARTLAAHTHTPTDRPQLKPRALSSRRPQLKELATAAANFLFRGTSGAVTAGYKLSYADDDGASSYAVVRAGGKKTVETSLVATFPRPAAPLIIYEFEGCPFCKRVREALVYYDVDATFYPCPRDGPNFRPAAIAEGGKKQFPYMKDPSTGVAMYESAAIVKYIADTYGDGDAGALLNPVTPLLIGLGLIARGGAGSKYRASKATAATQPLTLWAYEASPFCKLVRETLNELEIPHTLKTAARGSPKREELLAKTGHFQVPYLEDPNTGCQMFESTFIVEYLEKTYAA
jgi:glutathione S-transferase